MSLFDNKEQKEIIHNLQEKIKVLEECQAKFIDEIKLLKETQTKSIEEI